MGLPGDHYWSPNPQLGVEFYTPYNPIDNGLKYTGSNLYYYWFDHLGAVYGDGSMKPWGATYRGLISQYSQQVRRLRRYPPSPAG